MPVTVGNTDLDRPRSDLVWQLHVYLQLVYFHAVIATICFLTIRFSLLMMRAFLCTLVWKELS